MRLLRRNDGSIRGDMMVLEGRLKGNTGKYRLEIPRSEMQLFGGTGGKAFGFSMPPLAPPKKPAAAPTFDSWGGGGSSGGSGSSSGQLTVEAAAETAGAIAPTPALAMVSSYDEDLAQWAARRASGAAASTRGGSSGAAGTRSSSGSGSGGGSAYLQRYDTDVLFLPTDASLRYLDGSLPGDYGFDPLGLYDPATLASLTGGADGWFSQDYVRYSEVLHGRWAMLAAVGCLVPEMRPTSGALDPGIVWFRTGFIPSQSTVDYGIDLYDLCLLQAVVMGLLEARRFQDFLSPGSPPTLLPLLAPLAELERAAVAAQSSGGGTAAAPATSGGSRDPVYPGGPLFSPLMLVESEGALREFKLKEIKHGRLAMVALLGYTAQAVATQQGPFENLMQHLRDPLHNNIIFTVMRLAAAAQQARQFDADFL